MIIILFLTVPQKIGNVTVSKMPDISTAVMPKLLRKHAGIDCPPDNMGDMQRKRIGISPDPYIPRSGFYLL